MTGEKTAWQRLGQNKQKFLLVEEEFSPKRWKDFMQNPKRWEKKIGEAVDEVQKKRKEKNNDFIRAVLVICE